MTLNEWLDLCDILSVLNWENNIKGVYEKLNIEEINKLQQIIE